MSGRNVCDANCGVGGVDVLTAGAGCAISVNAQILFVDFHFDVFVNLRINKQRSKRSVTPGSLIKGRDAHQPVHSGFSRQQAVGIFAFHSKCYSFESGFFSRLVIDDFGLEAALFGPLQIHAQQHLGPVLRFSAACAGMNRADRIELIVVAAEQHLGFRNADLMLQTLDQRAKFFQGFFILFGKFKEHAGVGNLRFKLLLPLNLLLQNGSFLQKFLGRFLIVPKIRRRSLVLDSF